MNFVRTLFGISLILLHVQNISTEEYPFPLILEGDPPELKLALPVAVPGDRFSRQYILNSPGNGGPVQEFTIACPASTDEQIKIQENWRNSAGVSNESKLYFLQENVNTDGHNECPPYDRAGPSIQKSNLECGQGRGELYKVGYPVVKNEKEDIEFMALYHICYSKESDGMLYTVHRIVSPSAMLLELHRKYEPEVLKSYRSPLDADLQTVKQFYRHEYIYQFVPRFDMPATIWAQATLFPFNFTPIGSYPSMLENIMKYDSVVRLFSKQTNKRLMFYSGTYQKTIIKGGVIPCFTLGCGKEVLLNSIWKVIIDGENKATILITQHTREKCGKNTYICNEDFVLLEKYRKGGCTYQCSMNAAMIAKLGLPDDLEIQGKLDIRYTKTIKPKSRKTSQYGRGKSDSESTEVSITDFGNGLSFAAALMVVDAVTAESMQAEGVFDSDAGSGNVDNDNGDNDGAIEGATGHHDTGGTGNTDGAPGDAG